jgi:hypothetical protein
LQVNAKARESAHHPNGAKDFSPYELSEFNFLDKRPAGRKNICRIVIIQSEAPSTSKKSMTRWWQSCWQLAKSKSNKA